MFDERKFLTAAKEFDEEFKEEIEREKADYLESENYKNSQCAYLLATGSEATDDYDINLGIFLEVQALKQAYLKLAERKQREIEQDGYSMIETLKLYQYPKINVLLDNFCTDLKIEPESLGLPKVVDEANLPWK